MASQLRNQERALRQRGPLHPQKLGGNSSTKEVLEAYLCYDRNKESCRIRIKPTSPLKWLYSVPCITTSATMGEDISIERHTPAVVDTFEVMVSGRPVVRGRSP